MDLNYVEIHDATTNNNNQACEFIKEPDTMSNIVIYKNTDGGYVRDTMSLEDIKFQDNTTYDIGITEGKAVSIINGVFSSSKLRRLT